MAIFEAVKAEVTPRMAAERYGLRVSRSGMVRCLFHDDATPSMKLYDDHYHCFGCQATGDVIRMTAKLFGVPDAEAANKLAEDFGVQSEKTSVLAKHNMASYALPNIKARRSGTSKPITSAPRRTTPAIPMWTPPAAASTSIW